MNVPQSLGTSVIVYNFITLLEVFYFMSKFYRTEKFKQLQRDWYKKLYDEGFDDLEYFSFEHSAGQDGIIYDKVNFRIINKLRHMKLKDYHNHTTATYQHYTALRNFLTHADLRPSLDRKLLELYTDGLTYRKITEYLRTFICRYPPYNKNNRKVAHYSIFWVHRRLQELKKKAFIWNATHSEGILDFEDDKILY